jgi:membrane-associated HD superfamily phosphohydrolase
MFKTYKRAKETYKSMRAEYKQLKKTDKSNSEKTTRQIAMAKNDWKDLKSLAKSGNQDAKTAVKEIRKFALSNARIGALRYTTLGFLGGSLTGALAYAIGMGGALTTSVILGSTAGSLFSALPLLTTFGGLRSYKRSTVVAMQNNSYVGVINAARAHASQDPNSEIALESQQVNPVEDVYDSDNEHTKPQDINQSEAQKQPAPSSVPASKHAFSQENMPPSPLKTDQQGAAA